MPKEIILYNLNDSMTDEDYFRYCKDKKAPLIRSLPACTNYSLVRISGSQKGEIPYTYVGTVEFTSVDDWKRDVASAPFQNFLKEWVPMVKDFEILSGAEVLV